MRTKQVVWRALAGLFVFALYAAPTEAQTGGTPRGPLTIEAVGGANLATMSLPIIGVAELEDLFGIDVDFSISRRTGLVGGVLVGVPVGNRASFETGALVSVKGVSASLQFTVPGFGSVSGDSQIQMTYLDVPALARFRVASTSRGPISLLAGSTVSFRLHASSKVTFAGESMSETVTDEVTAVDFGLTFGGRVELGRGLVDVRYTHGLRNAVTESGPDSETIKHRVISFMAGWKF